MKTWLISSFFWTVVLAASACSSPNRNLRGPEAGSGGELSSGGSTSGAGGASGAGTAGKPGGTAGTGGRAGAGGQSPSLAGTAGDGEPDMAGAGGEPPTVFGCGGLTCAAEADCTGEDTSAHCVCPKGYTDPHADGTLCVDINECSNLNGGCDALLTCTNSPGSFSCGDCPAGYSGTPSTGCVDIDECKTNNGGCDKTVTCTNTPGSHSCGNCPFGYTGTGDTSCVDIDECKTSNGGCDATVTCTNTPGGHTCGACPAGYTGGGSSGCTDINECSTNNGGCDSHVTCTNSPGSYTCGACPSGYTGTGSTGCVDINECATNNGGCSGNATCTNTPGSRTCACKSGYTGDGVTCSDVNECLTNNGGCATTATCTNTVGSKTCACNSGYTGDGTTCSDVNECLTNNGGCSSNATCTNTVGSKTCACNSGFSGDGTTCTDVNECATNNGGCSANATCTNTVGSKTCACKSGFAGDGVTCNAPGTGCKWNGTGPTAAQVALDNDGDGHGSSACAANPGDDCDDTQAAIYPGAAEVCDGIDNDCDKKIDMADGLPLTGASKTLGFTHAALSAVTNDGTFGLLGNVPGVVGLATGTISTTGVGSASCCSAFTPSDTTNVYYDPHFAWSQGVGYYGVTYTKNGYGGVEPKAGTVAFTGCCWQDVPSLGKGDVTARTSQGDLLFAGFNGNNISLSSRNSSASTGTGTVAGGGTIDYSYYPSVGTNGTTGGIVWQTSSPRSLNWATISASLAGGSAESLSTSALYYDLEAITAGYGIAWIEGIGFKFMIKKANGATQCTSSVVSFGSGPSTQQVAVGDSANGNIVVATSPDTDTIHLYRFDNNCKLMDDADVNTTATSAPTEPRIARTGGHIVVYWSDASGGRYRFLSDLLCH